MSDVKLTKIEEAFAQMENGAETYKELRQRGASALHLAAFAGVVAVLKKAAPANEAQGDLFGSAWSADDRGNGVAHYAVEGKKVGALKDALVIGGVEEANRVNALGRSPLHYAAMLQDEQAVKTLLENGADVEIRNRDGDTPLHNAVWAGSETIAKLILSHNADVVNAPNGNGATPLMIAAQLGDETMTKTLIENGANIKALDVKGKSALHYAEEYSTNSMATLLEKLGANPDVEDLRGKSPYDYRSLREKDARKDAAQMGFARNLRAQRTSI